MDIEAGMWYILKHDFITGLHPSLSLFKPPNLWYSIIAVQWKHSTIIIRGSSTFAQIIPFACL